jgi:hypothetical protein
MTNRLAVVSGGPDGAVLDIGSISGTSPDDDTSFA